MNNYREYIEESILDGKTSLGPTKYLCKTAKKNLSSMVINEYERINKILEKHNSDKILPLITEASKVENNLKEFVEKACSDWVIKLFDIPQSAISIEMNLVQAVDKSGIRVNPDSIKIPENINSDYLLNEISKRRLLLSISSGIALLFSSRKEWLKMFSKTSHKLPKLYNDIINLRYLKIYEPEKKYSLTGNCFSTVFLTTNENKPEIRCDATCSPLLIEATIKSLLELSISTGLPKKAYISNIILSKTDFSLADKWDLMIGIPLWKEIAKKIKKLGFSISEIGVNFLLMEFSKMPSNKLFDFINNMLIDNPKSDEIISEVCKNIILKKEQDDFNDFVKLANNKFPINDAYMTSEELWSESFM